MWNYFFMVLLLTGVESVEWKGEKLPPLPMCSDVNETLQTRCIEIGNKKMTWMAAHKYCRSENGFLATREELPKMLELNLTSKGTWMSLTFVGSTLHSISQIPGFVAFDPFRYISPRRTFKEDCVKVLNGTVVIENCDTELDFLCSRENIPVRLHGITQLELTNGDGEKKEVWKVDDSGINFSVLECRTKNTPHNSTKTPNVFWRKDGVWLGHTGRYMVPFTVPNFPKEVIGNMEPTYQGTYCCGTWNSKNDEITQSNCVTLSLQSYESFIVSLFYPLSNSNITLNGSSSGVLENAVSQFETIIPDTVIPSKNTTFSLISVKPFNPATTGSYTVAFNVHVLRNMLLCSNFALHAAQTLLEASDPHNNIIPVIPEASLVKEKMSERCINTIKSVCSYKFTEGDFRRDPPRFCQQGYHLEASDRICLKVLEEKSWDEAFSSFSANSNRISLVSQGLIKHPFGPYYELKKMLLRENITLVWLHFRRMQTGGPIVSLINDDQKFIHGLFRNLPTSHGFSWREGEPSFKRSCVSFDITNNSLSTRNCEEKLPSIDIMSPTLVKKIKTSPWAVPDKCPSSWRPTFMGQCLKFFLKSVTSGQEAEDFCDYENGKVVTVDNELVAYMYRHLMKQENINSIFVRMTPTARFTKCLRSRVRSWRNEVSEYAVMNQNGFGERREPKVVACEKEKEYNPYSFYVKIEGHFLVAEFSDTFSGDSNSTKCLRNGFPLHNTFTSPKKLVIQLVEEGIYRCIVKTGSFLWISSNELYYKLENKVNIAVEASTDFLYQPIKYDSTIIKENKLLKPRCAASIFNVLNNTKWNPSPNWKLRVNLQYYFEKNGFLNMLLHLEFDQPKMTEKDLIAVIESKVFEEEITRECRIRHIRSTSGCFNDHVTTKTNISLSWSKVDQSGTFPPEELCVLKNGDLVTRKCSGDLIQGYKWDEPSGDCYNQIDNETAILYTIQNDPEKYFNMYDSRLSDKVRKENTSEADIYFVASTFKRICEDQTNQTSIAMNEIVQTMDNLLAARQSKIKSCQSKFNTSSILIETFEDLVFNTAASNDSVDSSIEKSQVVVHYLDHRNSSVIGFKVNSLKTTSVINKGENTSLEDASAAIVLPDTLSDLEKLLFIAYKSDKLFQDDTAVLMGKQVEGEVISASYRNTTVKKLPPEELVSIYFRVSRVPHNTECVFWDFERNQNKGGWSSEGCVYYGIQDGLAVCKCDHLTSFALLITYREARNPEPTMHKVVLEAISLVGCSLSIFGLGMVLLTFAFFKRWRKPLSNKILANLSFAILASMVIFVAGTSQIENVLLCRGIALSLHYFILASFSWMVVESVHQYLRFVKVIGVYIPRFMWKATIWAWGVPLIPVIAILIYDFNIYGGYKSKSNTICWMSGEGFFYAFLPPLGLTMLLNILIFGAILRSTFCTRSKIKSTLSKRDLLKNQLAMAIFVFFLLGFTWIFAFFAIFEMKIVFSYLFCIFNTLQGFIISVFHFSRDRQVKYLWLSWAYGMSTKSSLASRSSSRSTKSWSMNERSRMSTKSTGSSDSHFSHHMRSSKRARQQLRKSRSTFV